MKLSELTERECAFCGDRFMPNSPRQVFDTADCRYRHSAQLRWERAQAERAAREAAEALPWQASVSPTVTH